jgi:hypothetical protein
MCSADGPPVSNAKYLSSLDETGRFNLSAKPILNNPYNINFLSVHIAETSQTYRFPNGRDVEKSHSSLIYMPTDATQLRGIVLYFHSTIIGKWNVPSANGKEFQAIGGFYASQGYAVVMPDLLGYRAD